MSIGSRIGVVVLAAAVLMTTGAACKKKPVATPTPTPTAAPPVVQPTPTTPPPPPASPRPAAPAPPRVPTDDEVFAAKSLDDLNREKPLADVRFAYDVADLTEESRGVLQKNAAWLKRWTVTRIRIEGHADSRGTNEYNLALGERRASTVREYLVSLGIPITRMDIVSKGEEDPLCKEENESCWAQNRRGHFLITGK